MKILTLAKNADSVWLTLGFFAYVLSNLVSAWRWQQIVLNLGYLCSFAAVLRYYVQGITLNTFLPGGIVGGDVWRSMQLAEQAKQDAEKFGLHQAVLSVFLDRLGGLWGLSIWSLLTWGLAVYFLKLPLRQPLQGTSFFDAYLVFLLGAALMPICGLCLMYALANPSPKTNSANQFVGILQKLLSNIARWRWLHAGWKGQLRRLDSLWLTLPHSIIVQIFATLALWSCLQALSQPLDYLCVAGLCFAIFLSAVVPASFGGFGAREVACVVILGWLGVAEEVAFSASVLFGLLAMLQGALGIIYWFRKST